MKLSFIFLFLFATIQMHGQPISPIIQNDQSFELKVKIEGGFGRYDIDSHWLMSTDPIKVKAIIQDAFYQDLFGKEVWLYFPVPQYSGRFENYYYCLSVKEKGSLVSDNFKKKSFLESILTEPTLTEFNVISIGNCTESGLLEAYTKP